MDEFQKSFEATRANLRNRSVTPVEVTFEQRTPVEVGRSINPNQTHEGFLKNVETLKKFETDYKARQAIEKIWYPTESERKIPYSWADEMSEESDLPTITIQNNRPISYQSKPKTQPSTPYLTDDESYSVDIPEKKSLSTSKRNPSGPKGPKPSAPANGNKPPIIPPVINLDTTLIHLNRDDLIYSKEEEKFKLIWFLPGFFRRIRWHYSLKFGDFLDDDTIGVDELGRPKDLRPDYIGKAEIQHNDPIIGHASITRTPQTTIEIPKTFSMWLGAILRIFVALLSLFSIYYANHFYSNYLASWISFIHTINFTLILFLITVIYDLYKTIMINGLSCNLFRLLFNVILMRQFNFYSTIFLSIKFICTNFLTPEKIAVKIILILFHYPDLNPEWYNSNWIPKEQYFCYSYELLTQIFTSHNVNPQYTEAEMQERLKSAATNCCTINFNRYQLHELTVQNTIKIAFHLANVYKYNERHSDFQYPKIPTGSLNMDTELANKRLRSLAKLKMNSTSGLEKSITLYTKLVALLVLILGVYCIIQLFLIPTCSFLQTWYKVHVSDSAQLPLSQIENSFANFASLQLPGLETIWSLLTQMTTFLLTTGLNILRTVWQGAILLGELITNFFRVLNQVQTGSNG